MFPPARQRVVVIVSVVIGALAWSLCADALSAADGSPGLTLIDTRAGALVGTLMLMLAGIPALLGGLVSSATGTVLSGLFVVGAALAVLGAQGGGMEHWARGETMTLGGRYTAMAVEMVLWGAGIGAVTWVFGRLQPVVREWLIPGYTSEAAAPSAPAPDPASPLLAVGAGAVCALVAGIAAFMLIRSPDTGQVFWSLLLAFLFGGLAARMAVPGCSPLPIVVSPAVVGVAAYLWVALSIGDDRDAFLAALFSTEQNMLALPGIALALPIHYASAGVVGATLGIGWARHFAATAQRQASG